jgi:hypothetical protein
VIAIAISQAAFDAIAATLLLGDISYENAGVNTQSGCPQACSTG